MLEWLFGKRGVGAEPARTPAGESEITLADSPDPAEHFKLGKKQYEMGRMDEALSSFGKALALNPDHAEAHNNVGNVYEATGRTDDAISAYRRALSSDPTLANAHYNLGRMLAARGDSDGALACYYTATAIDPDFSEAHTAEGLLHVEKHRWDEASAALQKAVSIDPGSAVAQNGLGVVYSQHLDRNGEALACFRKAISIKPDYAVAYSNLGMTLGRAGQNAEAVAALRRALAIAPGLIDTRSNLLFYLGHDSTLSPEEIYAEHRAYGEFVEAAFRGQDTRHRNSPDPARRLRVGFVSADLRAHAVASFVEPLWAALDPKEIEIWVYSNHYLEDPVTLLLKSLAHHWTRVVGLSDEELAARILENGIDILFDLSGHSGDNRLPVFARKPAPIQVSWIGNPNTTGLTAMDYYLADRFSAPPGVLDHLFTEKIVRLPSGAIFQPFGEAPAVNDLPALGSGAFTFGSFSRGDKQVEGVVSLWSRVLHAVPEARMVLAGCIDDAQKQVLLEGFARNGIGKERLVLHLRVATLKYLALHHQVDMILDTYPFGGGTTTCHAAWMGVPVLTLAGKTMASRVGLIINSNLDLPEFITESEDEFVARAVQWSRRLPELATLRASLRARVLASPMCQPRASARSLEIALRKMWQRWCEGKPPESFGVGP